MSTHDFWTSYLTLAANRHPPMIVLLISTNLYRLHPGVAQIPHLLVQVQEPPGGTLIWLSTDTEICYNIRHFELHGRQSTDLWSCRQSAIYQKFYLSKGISTCIIIHQPLTLRESLQNARPGSFSHPMAIHIRYIRSASHNWRDLLGDISSDLARFVCLSLQDILLRTADLVRTASYQLPSRSKSFRTIGTPYRKFIVSGRSCICAYPSWTGFWRFCGA
jgi:hypothetical protein